MRKEELYKIIWKHGSLIKILWTVFAIISMIMAIRTYINYTTIQDAIINVEFNIDYAQEEIEYTNKFLKRYLDSEYADYFLAHKNNILFQWEYIIKFDSPKENKIKEDTVEENDNIIDSPQESRHHFIKSKLN